MDVKTTGALIAKIRKEKQLTQKQLAEQLGVTDKAVSKWERGINYPDIALLKPLAEVLNISITQLLGVEHVEKEEVLEMAAEISAQDKERIKRDIRQRSRNIIIVLLVVVPQLFWLSYQLDQVKLYGRPMGVVSGCITLCCFAIGCAIYMLIHIRKL